MITVLAPAKINLSLLVGPPRADGFHPLRTTYCAVGLYDVVSASPGKTLSVTMTGEGTEFIGSDNLVSSAAVALAEYAGVEAAATLTVQKNIPVAAGLAGGSADAAATLVACAKLWNLVVDLADLAGIAADIGSDVPFALYGGVAAGAGRGELITPLPAPDPQLWVIAAADFGLSTPEVFRELDQLRAKGVAPPSQIDDPAAPDINELQVAALSLAPELAATLAAGAAAGALRGFVSGSGPTCAFAAVDQSSAERIAAALREHARWAQIVPGPVAGAWGSGSSRWNS